MAYAIKAHLPDVRGDTLVFEHQKTMCAGKHIAEKDTVFIFDSEGGSGLVARAVVTAATATPRRPGTPRQTPRVSITVRITATAVRNLGRDELRRYSDWGDGRPETELNFMFYRQATPKIVRLSDKTAAFLQQYFQLV